MRRLMIVAASAMLMAVGMTDRTQAAVGNAAIAKAAKEAVALIKTQYVWGGRGYCWYGNGWHGPGWYWCGYAWRRGFGWGGGYGWHGWYAGHGRYWHGGRYGHRGWHGGPWR
jgi:hypothetical protein